MMNLSPKAPAPEERKKMAIAFIESASYQGSEFDQSLVKLIQKGMAIFKSPDLFQLTEEGSEEVENGKTW